MYVTWPPLEPDKCVAAWLLKVHVDRDAKFVFLMKGTPVSNGIAFDVPGSKYIRNHRHSTSEVVIHLHDIKDTKAVTLGQLARRIELGFWHATFTDNEQPLVSKLSEIKATRTNHAEALVKAFAALDAWEPK